MSEWVSASLMRYMKRSAGRYEPIKSPESKKSDTFLGLTINLSQAQPFSRGSKSEEEAGRHAKGDRQAHQGP